MKSYELLNPIVPERGVVLISYQNKDKLSMQEYDRMKKLSLINELPIIPSINKPSTPFSEIDIFETKVYKQKKKPTLYSNTDIAKVFNETKDDSHNMSLLKSLYKNDQSSLRSNRIYKDQREEEYFKQSVINENLFKQKRFSLNEKNKVTFTSLNVINENIIGSKPPLNASLPQQPLIPKIQRKLSKQSLPPTTRVRTKKTFNHIWEY